MEQRETLCGPQRPVRLCSEPVRTREAWGGRDQILPPPSRLTEVPSSWNQLPNLFLRQETRESQRRGRAGEGVPGRGSKEQDRLRHSACLGLRSQGDARSPAGHQLSRKPNYPAHIWSSCGPPGPGHIISLQNPYSHSQG